MQFDTHTSFGIIEAGRKIEEAINTKVKPKKIRKTLTYKRKFIGVSLDKLKDVNSEKDEKDSFQEDDHEDIVEQVLQNNTKPSPSHSTN